MICPVRQYADAVIAGEITAGRLVRLACERHIADLERDDVYFDEAAARATIELFRYFPHTLGRWRGQEFVCLPYQSFIVGSLFGWMSRETEQRRYRYAYVELSRKNGKSSIAARIALKLAFFDGEGGAEVYSAATTRDQAKIVWLEAMRVVRMSGDVRDQAGIRVRESVNTLVQDASASIYKPLASNDESSDGLNIHAAVVDELQAHKNASCWNVLENATGARLQPMIFAITYAGTSKQSICWQQRAHAVSVVEGLDDDATFSYIAALDEGDTWLDEKCWEKANPSLGSTITREYLRAKVRRAQELPAQMNSIRRAHFNEWTEGATAWVNIAKWDSSTARRVESMEYERAPCWGGLDLASNIDLTAFVLAFDLGEDGFFFLPKFWLPAENLTERVARDKVPYDVWARTGLLTLTEGNVCDYRIIREHILTCAEQYDLRDIGYDPYMATETAYLLQEEGVDMVPFRQGFLSMNEPTKKLERLYLGERCLTNGNPILRWNVLNAVSREDPAGNVKLDKGKSVEKIDGLIATIMALGRATLDQGDAFAEPRAMLIA